MNQHNQRNDLAKTKERVSKSEEERDKFFFSFICLTLWGKLNYKKTSRFFINNIIEEKLKKYKNYLLESLIYFFVVILQHYE